MSEQRDFLPLDIAVLTVSDSRDENSDRSGALLVELLTGAGHRLAEKAIVPDDKYRIREVVSRWIADESVRVVLSTGGTGVTGRDVTPEAVLRVAEKEIPGFSELFRWISFQKIKTSTIQSRALGAVAKGTYIFALPGSTGACKDAWDGILVHQLNSNNPPCNLVELMPRLLEK